MARPIPKEICDWIELVVADNADDLLRYLQRRVAQPEDAADLLGRVFLALWENGARIPAEHTDARMWCYGIARNILREHYRHTTKHVALADRLRDHLRTTPRPTNAADTLVTTAIQAATVRQAVRDLDARSRELIVLVHWDGFTIAEAARHLSINQSTARTRHTRALQQLSKTLRDGEVTTPGRGDYPQPRLTTRAGLIPTASSTRASSSAAELNSSRETSGFER